MFPENILIHTIPLFLTCSRSPITGRVPSKIEEAENTILVDVFLPYFNQIIKSIALWNPKG